MNKKLKKSRKTDLTLFLMFLSLVFFITGLGLFVYIMFYPGSVGTNIWAGLKWDSDPVFYLGLGVTFFVGFCLNYFTGFFEDFVKIN